MMVSVSVFENLSQGGPVSVSVFLKIKEKPDWTGLPSTIPNVFAGSRLLIVGVFK